MYEHGYHGNLHELPSCPAVLDDHPGPLVLAYPGTHTQKYCHGNAKTLVVMEICNIVGDKFNFCAHLRALLSFS